MEGEEFPEQGPAQSLLQSHDQMHDLGQGSGQVGATLQETGELRGDPRFLTALDLEQHILLGREVKVEGAVGDSGRGHDRAHLRFRHPGSLELG